MDFLKRLGNKLVVFLLFFGSLSSAMAEDGTPSLEYQIKASLIYNFLQFVEWPAPIDEQPSLTMCVLGSNPFGEVLNAMEYELIQGKRLNVKQVEIQDSPSECQVIFIPQQKAEEVKSVLDALRELPVLTVGENPEFLDLGGIIHFLIVSDKVAFEINRAAIYAARLTVSSKLLRLASKVLD